MESVQQNSGPKSLPAAERFEPLLNDQQAAQLLGNMHPRTLQRLARTGVIPAIKIGRFWFFRASTLDAWVSSQVQSQHRPCFSKENE
jgi:excisionase family DNA binding protein